MKCSKIHKKLSAYLDGEVSETDKRIVQEHLASCRSCQHAMQELNSLNDDIKRVPGMEVPPYFYTRLKQRMQDRSSTVPALEWIRRLALPGFAVVLTLLALALGNTMARTIYQEIADPKSSLQTVNVFGIDAFDEYPEGSVSNVYAELIAAGGQ